MSKLTSYADTIVGLAVVGAMLFVAVTVEDPWVAVPLVLALYAAYAVFIWYTARSDRANHDPLDTEWFNRK